MLYVCVFRVYVAGNAYIRVGVKLFMYYTNPESQRESHLMRFPLFNKCWLILIRPLGRSFSESVFKLRKASVRQSFTNVGKIEHFRHFPGVIVLYSTIYVVVMLHFTIKSDNSADLAAPGIPHMSFWTKRVIQLKIQYIFVITRW